MDRYKLYLTVCVDLAIDNTSNSTSEVGVITVFCLWGVAVLKVLGGW
jgi:hypothetical protein